MNRRTFLRRASLVAAGAIAVDQLDLVERIGWVRKTFPAWGRVPTLWGDGVHDDADTLLAFFAGRPVWDYQARRMLLGTEMLYGRQVYVLRPTAAITQGPPRGMRRGFCYSVLQSQPGTFYADAQWMAESRAKCAEMGVTQRMPRVFDGPQPLVGVNTYAVYRTLRT